MKVPPLLQKLINPWEWQVRLRIAIVVSILWGLAVFGQHANSRGGLYLSFPLFLFVGSIWIAHGVRRWHKRKKAAKERRNDLGVGNTPGVAAGTEKAPPPIEQEKHHP